MGQTSFKILAQNNMNTTSDCILVSFRRGTLITLYKENNNLSITELLRLLRPSVIFGKDNVNGIQVYITQQNITMPHPFLWFCLGPWFYDSN